MGDFGSVRAFARGAVKQLQAQQQKIKLLVNNAGPDLQLVYQEMACSSLQSCVSLTSLCTFQSRKDTSDEILKGDCACVPSSAHRLAAPPC